MILRSGRWIGRDSFVRQGQYLTIRVVCGFYISAEDTGPTIQDVPSEHGETSTKPA